MIPLLLTNKFFRILRGCSWGLWSFKPLELTGLLLPVQESWMVLMMQTFLLENLLEGLVLQLQP